jgi:hypothetical protein
MHSHVSTQQATAYMPVKLSRGSLVPVLVFAVCCELLASAHLLPESACHAAAVCVLAQPPILSPGRIFFLCLLLRRFKGPLTLLDGFFHMHGLGTSIITRRFRNGTELSPLAQLRMFDYEFQVGRRSVAVV